MVLEAMTLLLPETLDVGPQRTREANGASLPMNEIPCSTNNATLPKLPNSSNTAGETTKGLCTENNSTKQKKVKVEWPKHKDELKKLFVVENWPLSEVKRWMENTHGFPKMQDRAYEKAFQRLSITKNIPADVMRVIVQDVKKRAEQGKKTAVHWHGAEVDRKKIQRAVQDAKRKPAKLNESVSQEVGKRRKGTKYLQYTTPNPSRDSSPEVNRQSGEESNGTENTDVPEFPWDTLRGLVQDFGLTEFVRTYDETIFDGFEYEKSEREPMRLIKDHLIMLRDFKYSRAQNGHDNTELQTTDIEHRLLTTNPRDFKVFTLSRICSLLYFGTVYQNQHPKAHGTVYRKFRRIVQSLLMSFQAWFGDEEFFSPFKIIALCEIVARRWPYLEIETCHLIQEAIRSLRDLQTLTGYGRLNRYLGEFWTFIGATMSNRYFEGCLFMLWWYKKHVLILSSDCITDSILAWIQVLVFVAAYRATEYRGEIPCLNSDIFETISILIEQNHKQANNEFWYRSTLQTLVDWGFKRRQIWPSHSYENFLSFLSGSFRSIFDVSSDRYHFRSLLQLLILCCSFQPQRAVKMIFDTERMLTRYHSESIEDYSVGSGFARIRRWAAEKFPDQPDFLLDPYLEILRYNIEIFLGDNK